MTVKSCHSWGCRSQVKTPDNRPRVKRTGETLHNENYCHETTTTVTVKTLNTQEIMRQQQVRQESRRDDDGTSSSSFVKQEKRLAVGNKPPLLMNWKSDKTSAPFTHRKKKKTVTFPCIYTKRELQVTKNDYISKLTFACRQRETEL